MASNRDCFGNFDNEIKEKQQDIDTELDTLLDDALADFENLPCHQNNIQLDNKNSKKCNSNLNKEESSVNGHLSNTKLDQIYENLFKLAESGSSDITEDSSFLYGDVTETIQKAFNGLSENLGNIEGENDMSHEMLEMLSKMNLDDGETSIMPLVNDMMTNLLSKDVIYPSLNDICVKYPGWLAENEGKLQENEMKNYKQQSILIQQIVKEYESESPSDSEPIQKDRFEKILDLMQKMQQLGHPPKEILGDLAKDIPSDGAHFLPGMNDSSQCSIS